MTDKAEAMEHVIHSSMPIDFERRYAMDNLIAQDADLIVVKMGWCFSCDTNECAHIQNTNAELRAALQEQGK